MAGALRLYLFLAASLAGLAAALIFIIVDKTAYCRDPSLPEYSAVSYDDDGGASVVCRPGYVFDDGLDVHRIRCTNPPAWNTDQVPACIPVNTPRRAVRCSVAESTGGLTGQLLFTETEDASTRIQVQGLFQGLNDSVIQLLDVADDTSACHVTTDLQLDADWTSTDDSPLVIDGTALKIRVFPQQPLQLNRSFGFFVRAFGSGVATPAADAAPFRGSALLVLEQDRRSVGVFSTESDL